MIWQNPWAWLGLLALGVPVLIHLLGRRSARTQRFPTLRFIEATPPVSTRRTRLTDIPLLLVRMAILAAAVAALASPLLLTADRERDLGRAIARAIIVDTSASVKDDVVLGGGQGERPMAIAQREAAARAAEATTSVILETRDPAGAIAGAVAWIERQRGRRELVIISDFQVGSIDSIVVGAVPREVGIELVRVRTEAPAAYEVITRRGGEEIVARAASLADSGTASSARGAIAVEWTVRPSLSAPDSAGTIILAGAEERGRAEAAHRAAIAAGVPAGFGGRRLAVMYPAYERRAELLRHARPLNLSWQGNFVRRVAADPVLSAAAANAELVAGPGDSLWSAALPSPFVALARTRTGVPVVVAAVGGAELDGRLLLLVRSDAGSLVSAATLAAIEAVAPPEAPVAELDPRRIADTTLTGWRRSAAETTSSPEGDQDGSSDGRWLWMLVLVLLGVETWLRRAQREANVAEVARERAA